MGAVTVIFTYFNCGNVLKLTEKLDYTENIENTHVKNEWGNDSKKLQI